MFDYPLPGERFRTLSNIWQQKFARPGPATLALPERGRTGVNSLRRIFAGARHVSRRKNNKWDVPKKASTSQLTRAQGASQIQPLSVPGVCNIFSYANVVLRALTYRTSLTFCICFKSCHWFSIVTFSAPRLGACGGRAVNALSPGLAKGREAEIN